jgi:hypothetical protein
MSGEFIFGYGSLVNPATHGYGALHLATLSGWRRTWHHTTLRDLAYLSATPDPDASIQGVILTAPIADPALENRESDYDRHDVAHQTSHSLDLRPDINVFAIPARVHCTPAPASGLLLSYIDVVVQGYFHLAGQAGVQDFFATTHGWGAPIINDRAAPIYPRHQSLSAHEFALVDENLAALNATIIAA